MHDNTNIGEIQTAGEIKIHYLNDRAFYYLRRPTQTDLLHISVASG
jgi:hypothetical protein